MLVIKEIHLNYKGTLSRKIVKGICITADKNWHSLNINHNHYHLKHKFCGGKKTKPQNTNY